MEKSKHVLYTWLVAQLIHPCLYDLWVRMDGVHPDISEYFLFALVVFPFTFPAFLLCLLLFPVIIKLTVAKTVKLLIWMVVADATIPLSVFGIAVVLDGVSFYMGLFNMLIPGLLSASLSILLRYKQFFQLANQQNKIYHENNLV